MDRRGNRDEKPTYEELASALRYVVNLRKNYAGLTKEELYKLARLKAKEIVDKLDKVEAKQYESVSFPIPLDHVVKYKVYDENGLRHEGEVKL